MPKALLVVPSYHGPFYDDNAKTGLFYTEALHPYKVFKENGFDVDIISETGKYGLDEHSVSDQFLSPEDKKIYQDPNHEFNQALKNIKPASEVNPQEYAIAFAAAGHGALFDYPTATFTKKAYQEIYANGGVISAVCHGPAIFDQLQDIKTKNPIIAGKKVTGFTDIGEEQMGVVKAMNRHKVDSIKSIVERNGGTFIEPNGPWDDFTIVDSKVVSGVNPQSATSTAQQAVKSYSG